MGYYYPDNLSDSDKELYLKILRTIEDYTDKMSYDRYDVNSPLFVPSYSDNAYDIINKNKMDLTDRVGNAGIDNTEDIVTPQVMMYLARLTGVEDTSKLNNVIKHFKIGDVRILGQIASSNLEKTQRSVPIVSAKDKAMKSYANSVMNFMNKYTDTRNMDVLDLYDSVVFNHIPRKNVRVVSGYIDNASGLTQHEALPDDTKEDYEFFEQGGRKITHGINTDRTSLSFLGANVVGTQSRYESIYKNMITGVHEGFHASRPKYIIPQEKAIEEAAADSFSNYIVSLAGWNNEQYFADNAYDISYPAQILDTIAKINYLLPTVASEMKINNVDSLGRFFGVLRHGATSIPDFNSLSGFAGIQSMIPYDVVSDVYNTKIGKYLPFSILSKSAREEYDIFSDKIEKPVIFDDKGKPKEIATDLVMEMLHDWGYKDTFKKPTKTTFKPIKKFKDYVVTPRPELTTESLFETMLSGKHIPFLTSAVKLDDGAVTRTSSNNDSVIKSFAQKTSLDYEKGVFISNDSEKDLWSEDKQIQQFTSAATAVNAKMGKLPKIFNALSKRNEFKPGQTVLDYGGGTQQAGILAQNFLDKYGATEILYDQYNQSKDEQDAVIKNLKKSGLADIGLLSNVLNTIKEPERRNLVLRRAASLIKPGSPIHITTYEGNKSGIGAQSGKDMWQENRPTKSYLDEIKAVFDNVSIKNGVITGYVPQRSPENLIASKTIADDYTPTSLAKDFGGDITRTSSIDEQATKQMKSSVGSFIKFYEELSGREIQLPNVETYASTEPFTVPNMSIPKSIVEAEDQTPVGFLDVLNGGTMNFPLQTQVMTLLSRVINNNNIQDLNRVARNLSIKDARKLGVISQRDTASRGEYNTFVNKILVQSLRNALPDVANGNTDIGDLYREIFIPMNNKTRYNTAKAIPVAQFNNDNIVGQTDTHPIPGGTETIYNYLAKRIPQGHINRFNEERIYPYPLRYELALQEASTAAHEFFHGNVSNMSNFIGYTNDLEEVGAESYAKYLMHLTDPNIPIGHYTSGYDMHILDRSLVLKQLLPEVFGDAKNITDIGRIFGQLRVAKNPVNDWNALSDITHLRSIIPEQYTPHTYGQYPLVNEIPSDIARKILYPGAINIEDPYYEYYENVDAPDIIQAIQDSSFDEVFREPTFVDTRYGEALHNYKVIPQKDMDIEDLAYALRTGEHISFAEDTGTADADLLFDEDELTNNYRIKNSVTRTSSDLSSDKDKNTSYNAYTYTDTTESDLEKFNRLVNSDEYNTIKNTKEFKALKSSIKEKYPGIVASNNIIRKKELQKRVEEEKAKALEAKAKPETAKAKTKAVKTKSTKSKASIGKSKTTKSKSKPKATTVTSQSTLNNFVQPFTQSSLLPAPLQFDERSLILPSTAQFTERNFEQSANSNFTERNFAQPIIYRNNNNDYQYEEEYRNAEWTKAPGYEQTFTQDTAHKKPDVYLGRLDGILETLEQEHNTPYFVRVRLPNGKVVSLPKRKESLNRTFDQIKNDKLSEYLGAKTTIEDLKGTTRTPFQSWSKNIAMRSVAPHGIWSLQSGYINVGGIDSKSKSADSQNVKTLANNNFALPVPTQFTEPQTLQELSAGGYSALPMPNVASQRSLIKGTVTNMMPVKQAQSVTAPINLSDERKRVEIQNNENKINGYLPILSSSPEVLASAYKKKYAQLYGNLPSDNNINTFRLADQVTQMRMLSDLANIRRGKKGFEPESEKTPYQQRQEGRNTATGMTSSYTQADSVKQLAAPVMRGNKIFDAIQKFGDGIVSLFDKATNTISKINFKELADKILYKYEDVSPSTFIPVEGSDAVENIALNKTQSATTNTAYGRILQAFAMNMMAKQLMAQHTGVTDINVMPKTDISVFEDETYRRYATRTSAESNAAARKLRENYLRNELVPEVFYKEKKDEYGNTIISEATGKPELERIERQIPLQKALQKRGINSAEDYIRSVTGEWLIDQTYNRPMSYDEVSTLDTLKNKTYTSALKENGFRQTKNYWTNEYRNINETEYLPTQRDTSLKYDHRNVSWLDIYNAKIDAGLTGVGPENTGVAFRASVPTKLVDEKLPYYKRFANNVTSLAFDKEIYKANEKIRVPDLENLNEAELRKAYQENKMVTLYDNEADLRKFYNTPVDKETGFGGVSVNGELLSQKEYLKRYEGINTEDEFIAKNRLIEQKPLRDVLAQRGINSENEYIKAQRSNKSKDEIPDRPYDKEMSAGPNTYGVTELKQMYDKKIRNNADMINTFLETSFTIHIMNSYLYPLKAILKSVLDHIVATFSEYDKKYADYAAKAKDLSSASVLSREQMVKTASGEVYSATDVTAVAERYAASGINTVNNLEDITYVIKAATIAQSDYNTVANAAIKAQMAFGLNTKDISMITDAWVAGANASTAELSDMITGFQYVASSAKNAGLSVQDTAGYLAMLDSQGLANVATSFRQLLMTFRQAGKRAKFSAIFGFTDDDYRDMNKVLKTIRDYVNEATDEAERNRRLLQMSDALGGKVQGFDALQAFINVTDQQMSLIMDAVNTSGYTNKMYKEVTDNLTDSFAKMKTEFQSMYIIIGEKLAPYINIAVQGITKLAEGFNESSWGVHALAAGISALGVSLAGLGTTAVGAIGGILSIMSIKPRLENYALNMMPNFGLSGDEKDKYINTSKTALQSIYLRHKAGPNRLNENWFTRNNLGAKIGAWEYTLYSNMGWKRGAKSVYDANGNEIISGAAQYSKMLKDLSGNAEINGKPINKGEFIKAHKQNMPIAFQMDKLFDKSSKSYAYMKKHWVSLAGAVGLYTASVLAANTATKALEKGQYKEARTMILSEAITKELAYAFIALQLAKGGGLPGAIAAAAILGVGTLSTYLGMQAKLTQVNQAQAQENADARVRTRSSAAPTINTSTTYNTDVGVVNVQSTTSLNTINTFASTNSMA